MGAADSIVVLGLLGQFPLAGIAWQLIHHLVGLQEVHLLAAGVEPVSRAEIGARQLRHAEQALQDGRAFLVGRRFTTADMLLTTCLTWAVSYRVPVTAACLNYMERITSRQAYHASVAANS